MANTYATWNPSDKSASITLSGGDLTTTTGTGSVWGTIRANQGVSSGKWYWEITMTTINANPMVGVYLGTPAFTSYVGETSAGWSYFQPGNYVHSNTFNAYGASFSSGDIIGVALDMDGGTITMYKNNTSQGQMASGLSGTFYPALSLYSSIACSATANFGASTMAYSPPSGYNAGLYTTSGPTFSPRMSLLGVGR